MLVARVQEIKPYTKLNGWVTGDAFWVVYSVVRDGKFEHHGERLVRAKDELEVFQRFPVEIIERHGVESIEWVCNIRSDK